MLQPLQAADDRGSQDRRIAESQQKASSEAGVGTQLEGVGGSMVRASTAYKLMIYNYLDSKHMKTYVS